MKTILITGSSGLLGRSLVDTFGGEGFFILAQYHKHPLPTAKNTANLFGDFSSSQGIQQFLKKNENQLKKCTHLINNYGPITHKPSNQLTPMDFLEDFHHNVITSVSIIHYLIHHAPLESVITIGFSGAGEMKAYHYTLPYALSKNGLLLITKSFAKIYTHIRFNMVSPGSITGAQVPHKKITSIHPDQVSKEIFRLINEKTTGEHIKITGSADESPSIR